MNINLTRLPHALDLELPSYATEGSAGLDLSSALDASFILKPWERMGVPTGIALSLPLGVEGQVRTRSGLALRSGIVVLNSPGTIDSDFRGEIKVILFNASPEPFTVERGMRIAQLVIAPYTRIRWRLVDNLDATERGEGGFGSTGVNPLVSEESNALKSG
eukprot:g8559.t1